MTTVYREHATQFGAHGHLAGLLTRPPAPPSTPPPLACVLVNAGMVPKFGRYRLYPELARRLAAAGVPTLRFDLSGMGDSRQEAASLPLRERMAADIRAAVDSVLASTGASGVVLGGLCSGGEDALRYAETDHRVRGVVMVDPFAYRTPGFAWRNAAFRAVRRSLRALGVYQPFANPAGDALVHYVYMAPDESRRILGAMIARQAPLHFIYTGGKLAEFNHAGQLQAMFPGLDFAGQVTVDLFLETEHTQVQPGDRERLVETICQRLVTAHHLAPRPAPPWLARPPRA